MMAKIWTKHSKPPLNIQKPGGQPRQTCGKERRAGATPAGRKMRIFCRLPRAGYKTADDTDLHTPLNDAYHMQVAYQGAASTRRTIAGTGKPAPYYAASGRGSPNAGFTFYPSDKASNAAGRNIQACAMRGLFLSGCAGIENAGEVGMWAKKKPGNSPRIWWIVRI